MSAALPIPPGIFRLSLPDICRSERYARGKSQKGRKAQLMRKFTQAAGSERGIALVAALLALLVLSTLTTAFIFVANTETSTTTNYKALTQGRYLAEAGVERTLNWMHYNYVAPSETLYNTTKSPVQWPNVGGAPVILSGRD